MKCPDCGKEISTAAPACPNCGRPNPAMAQAAPPKQAVPAVQPQGEGCFLQTLNTGCMIIFAIIAIIGLIFVFGLLSTSGK
jgi:uncharacterized membrane protein YvbJ